MGQNLATDEKVDHVLLAMSSLDLKRVMCGVMGMLEIFEQEIHREQSQSLDTMKVGDHIAYMQFAAVNMLTNLDALLSTLNAICPAVKQLVPLEKHFDTKLTEHISSAQRERWISELSKLPPHIWSL